MLFAYQSLRIAFILRQKRPQKTMTVDIIFQYFTDLTPQQRQQFAALQPLYVDWNSKINVISRKDMEQFYVHHVLHSLSIAKIIDFKPQTKILDIGTGGGFPGIPLAILFPEVQFHLIDSIGKKIKVVEDVATQLGLPNVKAQQIRVEDLEGKYDFILSRAVTEVKNLYFWGKKKIAKTSFNDLTNGLLLLKGGDLKAEFEDFNYHHRFTEVKTLFAEEYFETKKIVYVKM